MFMSTERDFRWTQPKTTPTSHQRKFSNSRVKTSQISLTWALVGTMRHISTTRDNSMFALKQSSALLRLKESEMEIAQIFFMSIICQEEPRFSKLLLLKTECSCWQRAGKFTCIRSPNTFLNVKRWNYLGAGLLAKLRVNSWSMSHLFASRTCQVLSR